MTDLPNGRPASLGQLLQTLVRRRGLAEVSAVDELDRLWKQVSGERVAAGTRVQRLRGGVLEIGVSNGTIHEELSSYLKHDLLQLLQQKYPERRIQSLRFVKVQSRR
ncbi:MAG: DUF721 domain-containing protein [Planctomycetaceae bacterium]|nr:DUF721 domain-containing protein [Planctomycetaceae bacterium]